MANDTQAAVTQELTDAISELRSALQRASDAATRLERIVPRVNAIGSLFDELANVIHNGRQQFGAPESPTNIAEYARPTLVVPEAQAVQQAGAEAVTAPTPAEETWTFQAQTEPTGPKNEDLVSFRLEFESNPGPLDLRAVDEAISEHPAVRDVALVDYDGRRATLKVWITPAASPSEVQQSLSERASQIFPGGNDVTIVALEDVA
jgi:hypothetical protein